MLLFWTKEDCQKWLPYVIAVAQGKEIEEWTGAMEKVQDGDDTQYSEVHRFTDENGNVYASALDTEYNCLGNILPIIRSNKTTIDPLQYLRIKEN